jgi:hypothetical protein
MMQVWQLPLEKYIRIQYFDNILNLAFVNQTCTGVKPLLTIFS